MEQITPVLFDVIEGPIKSMFMAVTGLFVVFCGLEIAFEHLSNYITRRREDKKFKEWYGDKPF